MCTSCFNSHGAIPLSLLSSLNREASLTQTDNVFGPLCEIEFSSKKMKCTFFSCPPFFLGICHTALKGDDYVSVQALHSGKPTDFNIDQVLHKYTHPPMPTSPELQIAWQ